MDIKEGEISNGVDISGEPFVSVIRTRHCDGIIAETAVHSDRFKHHIGGTRLVAQGGRTELGHLSSAMTLKCGVAGLPAGGQKTIVSCNGAALPTPEARAAVIAAHIKYAVQHQQGLIYGPDMGIAEPEIDLLAVRHGLSNHVSGCSEAVGGLSIDETGYTAFGLNVATRLARAEMIERDVPLRTVTIQGFGAVGMHYAQLAAQQGLLVRAVNNITGTLIDLGAAGLDVARLCILHRKWGDACLERYAEARRTAHFLRGDRDVIFEAQADIFVPAARVGVLATRDELQSVRARVNPEAVDAEHFWRLSGVKLIVQGANHPLTTAAERALEARGVQMLPDYLVNLGGLVGCFLGWLCRDDLRDGLVQVEDVHCSAKHLIEEAVTRNVSELLAMPGSARQAAQTIARARILDTQARFEAHLKGATATREAIRAFLQLPEPRKSAA